MFWSHAGVLVLPAASLFKGRSGWCGTSARWRPIQRTYGHAPLVLVKTCTTCPSMSGCQKNCSLQPSRGILPIGPDPDPWYYPATEFFIAALREFILGFFLAQDPAETGSTNTICTCPVTRAPPRLLHDADRLV